MTSNLFFNLDLGPVLPTQHTLHSHLPPDDDPALVLGHCSWSSINDNSTKQAFLDIDNQYKHPTVPCTPVTSAKATIGKR